MSGLDDAGWDDAEVDLDLDDELPGDEDDDGWDDDDE